MATHHTPSRDAAAEWQATRAAEAQVTRLLDDDPEVEADADIGVRVNATLRELFVSCDADLALQQQFEHLAPDFIALHDVGTHTSRGLLARLAAASSQVVQRLSIRRQGFGHELALLEFVDLPTPNGQHLRLFSTEIDADTATRHAMAHTLLGHARLGVVMVGALPAHALATALRPLQDAMRAAPWINRHLLFMPLAAPGNLAQIAADIASDLPVEVQTTPRVTRPSDAWNFISSSWNRLRDAPAPAPAVSASKPAPAAAADPAAAFEFTPVSAPMPMPTPFDRRTPPAGSASAAARATAPESELQTYIDKIIAIKGMVSACVFDTTSGQPLVHAGARPDGSTLASHGQQLLSAMWNASRVMGLGQTLPEAAITLGQNHLLLRALPGRPGLAVHAVLDQTLANLTLARVQLQNLDSTLANG